MINCPWLNFNSVTAGYFGIEKHPAKGFAIVRNFFLFFGFQNLKNKNDHAIFHPLLLPFRNSAGT